jgi:hypothetical protein
VSGCTEKQKNQSDRDVVVMESALQVDKAVQDGLNRKKDTKEGKEAAVLAAEKATQEKLSQVQTQVQVLDSQLSATQQALANATGQNVVAPAPVPPTTTHHKKVPTTTPPTTPPPTVTPAAPRRTPR